MANIDLKFLDFYGDVNNYIKISNPQNENGQETIEIFGVSDENGFSIYLDKSTAIKFAKTLRTEINKIQ